MRDPFENARLQLDHIKRECIYLGKEDSYIPTINHCNLILDQLEILACEPCLDGTIGVEHNIAVMQDNLMLDKELQVYMRGL